jgi:hypothetical protein
LVSSHYWLLFRSWFFYYFLSRWAETHSDKESKFVFVSKLS